MELKNLNVLNIFKKNELTDKKVAALLLTLLPISFVASSIEASLVYLLYYLLFLIVTTLVLKLVEKVSTKENNYLITILVLVGASTLISQVVRATNSAFYNDYQLYIHIFSLTGLPYLLKADNVSKNIGHSLLETLKSFIGVVVFILILAILREFIGTGGISFGKYINLEFSFSILKDYALLLFVDEKLGAFGNLILLGIILAVYVKVSKKEELV